MTRRFTVSLISACAAASAAVADNGALDGAIRPITNPVYLDSPDVGTLVHPLFMHHKFPDKVNTTLGDVPLGGDAQVYAVQLEIAFNDTLSLIAVKDGWVDFNPDNTDTGFFAKEEGIADLAAGLKWVFHRNEEKACLASARLVLELPTGDDEIWQGNGDGTIDPAVTIMKIGGGFQFIGTVGYIYAIDDDETSSMLYDAWHLSYNIQDRVFPLVELNHFRVTEEGSGPRQFTAQVDGGVPAVARFEGPDLVNLGAANADDNEDQVTLGLGCRFRANEQVDIGAAYEFPLTDDKDGLTDSRITVDLVWHL